MATRNPKGLTGEHTDFVLHKSQRLGEAAKGVIDFTEHRLVRFAAAVTDPQQKATLMMLITNYRNGDVAVAWTRGQPVWLPVTKG